MDPYPYSILLFFKISINDFMAEADIKSMDWFLYESASVMKG